MLCLGKLSISIQCFTSLKTALIQSVTSSHHGRMQQDQELLKANTSDTEATFLDLHLSISNDIISTKIYNKRDDFDFEIVNFPF